MSSEERKNTLSGRFNKRPKATSGHRKRQGDVLPELPEGQYYKGAFVRLINGKANYAVVEIGSRDAALPDEADLIIFNDAAKTDWLALIKEIGRKKIPLQHADIRIVLPDIPRF